ncbi:MAG: 5-formyltetrahydrofolate cyclo-ligase [Candidatus Poribacteria bacterium]|nr:5-formyltetrahydrofolate cyclo-ligase [Candidatus Poribacteria bacterium]
MDIKQKRDSIRSDVLRHRENLSDSERIVLSKQIVDHVIEWVQNRTNDALPCSFDAVMVYLSMKSEVDTWEFINSLLDLNKLVIAPVVDTNSSRLIPRQIQNIESDLVRHRYGMLEPHDSCPIFPLDQLNLILVPGIAFDYHGYRLGYGKGFYDRFLPTCPNAVAIGLAFQLQLVDTTYPQQWDIPVQHIFTENGLLSSK